MMSRTVEATAPMRGLELDLRSGRAVVDGATPLAVLEREAIVHGFFAPSTPDRPDATLAELVAADAIGREHHARGPIGEHVQAITLELDEGVRVRVSEEHDPARFFATLGGLGLTGRILEVELELRPVRSAGIRVESRRVDDLDELVDTLDDASRRWPYVAGWLDGHARGRALGRGVVTAGDWASRVDARWESDHVDASWERERDHGAPEWTLDTAWSRVAERSSEALGALRHHGLARVGVPRQNDLRFRAHVRRVREQLVRWDRFFQTAPPSSLPTVRHLSVVPTRERRAVRRIVERVAESGLAMPGCGLSIGGPEGRGALTFARHGIVIALELEHREPALAISLARLLDEEIGLAGGRVAFAENTISDPARLRAIDPRLARLGELCHTWDPSRRLAPDVAARWLGER